MKEDEKSMTEYKKQTGISGWIQSLVKKAKEIFRPKTRMKELQNESADANELTEDQLGEVIGGIPLNAVDMDQLLTGLDLPKKTWDLTPEQKEVANDRSNGVGELSEIELDGITAGHPIIEGEEYGE